MIVYDSVRSNTIQVPNNFHEFYRKKVIADRLT